MTPVLIKGQQGPDVAKLRKALAKALGAQAGQFPKLATGKTFDAQTEAAVRYWQAGVGVIADGIVGAYGLELLGLLPLTVPALALPQVQHLFPATKPSNVRRYLPYVVAALEVAGVKGRPLLLTALAIIRAESEGFVPIAELPSQLNTLSGRAAFSRYEGVSKLGNSQPGDGARFRGRGYVQLTGRAAYQRWGQQLGLDLTADPDLANAPEVAAALLALHIAAQAPAIGAALKGKGKAAKPAYPVARKLVNDNDRGLDGFVSVFETANGIPAPKVASKPGKTGLSRRNATKDPVDLRDRVYQPPPAMLQRCYPDNAQVSRYLSGYTQTKLILDQGEEGACTGFGLACVINYQRWRRADMPKAGFESVSPRMLYDFARRYDEYAGEDYDGSSCRGALKGWFHHGVCLEKDWPYQAQGIVQPQFGYAERATENTLGVYYRIDVSTITDLQAAIQEAGVIYVSAFTHDGWDLPELKRTPKPTHQNLPQIEYDGHPSTTDGHAFALVGFNTVGFIVQNSWGAGWGNGGFAVLTYADWLANAMDAWIAALGVPGVVLGQLAAGGQASTGRAGVNKGLWWDERTAYQHSVVLGDDGRVSRYLTQDELTRTLQYQACVLPDQWLRAQSGSIKRLVIIVHGGLNSEAVAIKRAQAMGRYFMGNGCYPLFVVWKTGLLESLGDILRKHMPGGGDRAGGMLDAIGDASDALLEPVIRPLAKPIWSEMKQNAEASTLPTRGGDHLVSALQNLQRTWGENLQIHLLGHSAGAIFIGWLLDVMAARQVIDSVNSVHLYAPACTVQFANRHYAPHERLMKSLYMDILSDQNERDDNTALIYRKSLLYLVSSALEQDLRTPILGLMKVLDADYRRWDGSSATAEALRNWRAALLKAGLKEGGRLRELVDSKVATYSDNNKAETIRAAHGCFDNALQIVSRTLERIIDKQPLIMPIDDLRGY
ncbi:C1 family peptidase [Pseudomonas sp. NPDC089401]|uniref:C1 family peptidase n=1 Tax=Pseudomonas sp. NPDC089401 TaxID=3364462 RepID=UPI003827F2F2